MSAPEPKSFRAEVSDAHCMGVAMCRQVAPRGFRIGESGHAVFVSEGGASLAELLDAADACPMAAVTVIEDE